MGFARKVDIVLATWTQRTTVTWPEEKRKERRRQYQESPETGGAGLDFTYYGRCIRYFKCVYLYSTTGVSHRVVAGI